MKIQEVEDGDKKTKGIRKGSVLNESPLGAGLKDGTVLAFRFREGDDDDEGDDDFEWDVVIPSYDDDPPSQ